MKRVSYNERTIINLLMTTKSPAGNGGVFFGPAHTRAQETITQIAQVGPETFNVPLAQVD